MLSYRSFTVSDLTFTSLIHLKLNFVSGIRQGSDLICLHVNTWFSQHHLLKRLFFPVEYSWPHCRTLIDCTCMLLFLDSLSCSIDPRVCFCASAILFFITVVLKFERMWCLQLCYYFWRLLWLSRVLCGSIQILGFFFPFLWKMSLAFWQGLHWIYTSLWVAWYFSKFYFFQFRSMR